MILANRRGVTAIELVVGIGIVAILTGIVITSQMMVTKEQVKMSNQLESSIDTTLAERMVFRDLNAVDPSYNNLLVKDDAGFGFFDYYPDVPAQSLTTPINREVTLKLGQRTEFYILVQDQNAGPLMNYDPPAAYNIGTAPADFNKSADLQFSSLNRNKWVSVQRPNFWVQGRLLMLDTPARVRPLNKTGMLDMSIAPRSPIFIGAVNGESLIMDGVVKGLINVAEPETGDEIANPDIFFRRLPAMGGGQPLVRLRAVKMIKYYLAKYSDPKLAASLPNLYKAVYEDGKWSDPILLADKVESFNLRRDSVLKRIIYFKLKKAK